MIVVPEGNASARFDVYSANDGVNKTYEVDLVAETCECPDHEHRNVECKHIKRVKLALGILPVPAGVELDEALVHDRKKYGVNPEPSAGSKAVVADGGEQRPGITRHVEPESQALVRGEPETYFRCEGCGTEAMRRQDLESRHHRRDCEAQRVEPARSEPADFGGGESTGVQTL